MKSFCILLLCLGVLSFVSCGYFEGEDGENGKSANCSIADNTVTCIDADGNVTEAEIKDGVPGEAAVVSTCSCALDLKYGGDKHVYHMDYNEITFSSGHVLASLKYHDKESGAVVFQEAAVFSKGEKVQLESPSWKVSAKELQHKPSQTKYSWKCS